MPFYVYENKPNNYSKVHRKGCRNGPYPSTRVGTIHPTRDRFADAYREARRTGRRAGACGHCCEALLFQRRKAEELLAELTTQAQSIASKHEAVLSIEELEVLRGFTLT